jgi:hypothetical protein
MMKTLDTRGTRSSTPRLSVSDETRWNRKVRALGHKGLGAATIADATGLTVSQVRTRLSYAGIRLNSYRRGDSPESRRLMRQVDRALGTARELREMIARITR